MKRILVPVASLGFDATKVIKKQPDKSSHSNEIANTLRLQYNVLCHYSDQTAMFDVIVN